LLPDVTIEPPHDREALPVGVDRRPEPEPSKA